MKDPSLPKVIIHNLLSADGRMDWFEPDIGLYYEVAAAFREQAILTGSETVLQAPDQVPPPEQTPEPEPRPRGPDRRPLFVVVDSRARIDSWHYLKTQPFWRACLVLVSESTPKRYLSYLEQTGIEYLVCGKKRVDLEQSLNQLRQLYGVRTVRVDSGGTLNGILLRAGLVDEVSMVLSPSLVGGETPRSIFHARDLKTAEGVIPLRLKTVEKLKRGHVWLRYRVLNRV
ncbi:MAG: RibD family protein [candidate division WOR-3 bacterium]|nr:MAG: RibD family protein [candidate division WOR-3 bacterium]